MENTGKTIHEKIDMLTPSQVNMILLYLLICKEINVSGDHDADAICKALQGELAEKADLEHVRRCPNAENPDNIEISIDVMDGAAIEAILAGVVWHVKQAKAEKEMPGSMVLHFVRQDGSRAVYHV